MYDVCILVCKHENIRHFNVVKCDDLELDRSILVAERVLTHFGRVVSDEKVAKNVRHYRLLNKDESGKIESSDAYICTRWTGNSENLSPLIHKYAIRETTFAGGIERHTVVDSISDNLDEARKSLQNRRWYINRELRTNSNVSSISTEGDELNKVVFNYLDRSDGKFKSIEIQIVDTGK